MKRIQSLIGRSWGGAMRAAAVAAATPWLWACQTAQKSETPRQQASDLFHEAEGSGTVVLVVIALIVAWVILLGFVGRITKIKNP
jgi:hypothetical protein